MKGFIFDLDGIVVDTAKYHYLAWKKLAGELGFLFEYEHNERLKGVSRMQSLEIVLEVGKILGLSQEEKDTLANRKNEYYLEMIQRLDEEEILPGIEEFLEFLKKEGKKVALGSASKSGGMILEKLNLRFYFDAIVDGNLVSKAKPDSEVFVKAAQLLGLCNEECVVIEDSKAGVIAAKSCGMRCIGIGEEGNLEGADLILPNTKELLCVTI